MLLNPLDCVRYLSQNVLHQY